MKSFIISALMLILSWYLLGAFVAADLNIANWLGSGRYFIGVFMIISVIGDFMYHELNDKFKK